MDSTNSRTKTSGVGTLTLTGNNTYRGGTIINSGTLNVTADANLGLTSGSAGQALTINAGTLEASGSFTTFAIDYFKKHPDVSQDFEVTGSLLDDFQLFLSQRNIQPGIGDWSRERDFIRNRLKAEIFNQAFGVEKGDEIEAQRDPQIQKALEIIGKG